MLNRKKICWFLRAVLAFLCLALEGVLVQGAVTFESTPLVNAVFGQNLAFKCTDSTAGAACKTNPRLPECSSKNANYNKIAYSHTLSNGTVIKYGTCSKPETARGWEITWTSCDKTASTLIIVNVTLEVKGTWTCVSGSAKETLSIGVYYPPMLDFENALIYPPPATLSVSHGKNISYAVYVKANPSVSVYTESCLRANVASKLKLIQKRAGKEYLLSLKSAAYSDYGVHICRIKNIVGILELKYLVQPKGPDFTIAKGKITAVSAKLVWPPQNIDDYTPSYIIYYKLSNATKWLASNEKKPFTQPPGLTVTYKQENLVPDSDYDFKVKLVIEAIKHMNAAKSKELLRIKTYSRPNITTNNIRVTTDADLGETFVAWDSFVGRYTRIEVKFCLLEPTGKVGTCDVLTISDPKRTKVKLDLKRDRSYTFYFYVFDGEDEVFASSALVAKSVTDPNSGVKLSGGAIGGIVVGIIAGCLVLTALIIVGVRAMRERKQERSKATTTHSESKKKRGDRPAVRFGGGQENPSMVPDPYLRVGDIERRPANGKTPSSTIDSAYSGVYETVDDDGSRFYETPLPSPPQKPQDPSTYTPLNAERIYLNLPPPESGPSSAGQTSPKLDKQQRIYENLPHPDGNKKARPPDVSTVSHIYVNAGFNRGSSSIEDAAMPEEERRKQQAAAADGSDEIIETRF